MAHTPHFNMPESVGDCFRSSELAEIKVFAKCPFTAHNLHLCDHKLGSGS
jgi:hypothetical protein